MSRFNALRRPLLALVLATAIGATFGIWRAGTASATSPVPIRFSAVQISDAVLFNEGAAAPFLASLRRPPTQWTTALRATQARINQMIAADAGFSYAFVNRMQSRDPLAVTAAMGDLGRLLRIVLEAQYGRTVVDELVARFDDAWSNNRTLLGTIMSNQFVYYSGHEVWIALDVAVAAEVAVVAVVAAVLLAVVGFGTPDAVLSAKTLLAKEIAAREIAFGLSAR